MVIYIVWEQESTDPNGGLQTALIRIHTVCYANVSNNLEKVLYEYSKEFFFQTFKHKNFKRCLIQFKVLRLLRSEMRFVKIKM